MLDVVGDPGLGERHEVQPGREFGDRLFEPVGFGVQLGKAPLGFFVLFGQISWTRRVNGVVSSADLSGASMSLGR
ncbi:hypothetical protein SAMN04489729_0439 [Amycolatopsis lurida]|uniref:Uncharacterized protein n=1 Tax=Amycolatopsis lurida NRRL 2430 TaxID=1460371 RepID=A0A2P2FY97_AMYLU|nr:hypothetical protein [Amycolatopsis lurida]KFU81702.1 hypothetical protein BB31_07555 [Amycolatopsis lurida NRRL 2430]SEB33424.1 hypothetical protein SAMN04489729_0439 [Amycolatopsis lurida]